MITGLPWRGPGRAAGTDFHGRSAGRQRRPPGDGAQVGEAGQRASLGRGGGAGRRLRAVLQTLHAAGRSRNGPRSGRSLGVETHV